MHWFSFAKCCMHITGVCMHACKHMICRHVCMHVIHACNLKVNTTCMSQACSMHVYKSQFKQNACSGQLYTCRPIWIELYNCVNLISAIIIDCMCAVQDTHNASKCPKSVNVTRTIMHVKRPKFMYVTCNNMHVISCSLCACNTLVSCLSFA